MPFVRTQPITFPGRELQVELPVRSTLKPETLVRKNAKTSDASRGCAEIMQEQRCAGGKCKSAIQQDIICPKTGFNLDFCKLRPAGPVPILQSSFEVPLKEV